MTVAPLLPAPLADQAMPYLLAFRDWLTSSVFTFSTALQLGILLAGFIFGALLARPLKPLLSGFHDRHEHQWFEPALTGLLEILLPLCSLVFLWLFTIVLARLNGAESEVLSIANTLLGVWILVRFVSCFIQQERLARFLAVTVWTLAALSILGLLMPAREQLNAIGMSFGKTRITLLVVGKALIALVGMLWIAQLGARITERQVQGFTSLTPSLRVLLSKIVKVLLLFLAFVITLNTLGIDLTSLAVFSGFLGVGLGFGLQKVVSNFISGLILLLDRSIKPGDVIYISDTDTYGWVNTLGARCVSVITRDGKEHLIPNELLITEKVENWSYSSKDVRIKITVAVSFDSDLRLALRQMKEAAKANARILDAPPPNALVREIKEWSVQLELRAWIDDPVNGIGNVSSDILLDIWDRFREHGIRFPYPQQDIHLRTGSFLPPAES